MSKITFLFFFSSLLTIFTAEFLEEIPKKFSNKDMINAIAAGDEDLVAEIARSDLDVGSFRCNDIGNTFLHMAVKTNSAIVDALLDESEDAWWLLDVKNGNDQTPLRIAVQLGKERIVRKLVDEYDANLNETTHGYTLLHVNYHFPRPNILNYLIKKGLDVNGLDEKGDTPLLSIAGFASPWLIRLFARNGANVNAVDVNRGYTPLHWAVLMGHKEIVMVLLDCGADWEKKCNGGNTPIMLARQDEELYEIEKILENWAENHKQKMDWELPY